MAGAWRDMYCFSLFTFAACFAPVCWVPSTLTACLLPASSLPCALPACTTLPLPPTYHTPAHTHPLPPHTGIFPLFLSPSCPVYISGVDLTQVPAPSSYHLVFMLEGGTLAGWTVLYLSHQNTRWGILVAVAFFPGSNSSLSLSILSILCPCPVERT